MPGNAIAKEKSEVASRPKPLAKYMNVTIARCTIIIRGATALLINKYFDFFHCH